MSHPVTRFFEKSAVVNMIYLNFIFKIWESQCRNNPPKIGLVAASKDNRVKNLPGGFFTLCNINDWV